MKKIKSVLAVVLVLVIGVCLTACQTPEEKAESERPVSESVADSERIVSESERIDSESLSESVSITESIVLEERKKEENAEFLKWFSVAIEPLDSGSGFLFTIDPTAYGIDKMDEFFKADNGFIVGSSLICNLIIDGTEYSFSNTYAQFVAGEGGTLKNVYIFEFEDITTKNYDSLTVKLVKKNGEETTLTHYPNA
jgi:hypothetical protein